MIREERLLKVLRAPHVSEKASTAMEKSNTIVLKVAKDATKAEIKAAVQKGVDQEKKDEFRTGYELGHSNATKSLYWNIQGLHEAKNQPDSQVIYYQIPADYPADGANRTPGSVMLPVVTDRR